MKPRPWRAFPSRHLPGLLDLRWQADQYGSKSAKTAGLMIYIGLIFLSAEAVHESSREQETIITLAGLEALTGISRPKIILISNERQPTESNAGAAERSRQRRSADADARCASRIVD